MLKIKRHIKILTKANGRERDFDIEATIRDDNSEELCLVGEAIESVRPCRAKKNEADGDETVEFVPQFLVLHLTSGEEMIVGNKAGNAILKNLGVTDYTK